jgi:molybdenum cofactor biosynthesis protein B
VVDYRIVKDEPDQVLQALTDFSAGLARIIIFNGGTGIGRRDRTYDVISKALDKTLPGFGELFRLLSYQEIGAAALLTRATAGIYGDKVVFSTPGSPHAVRLAMEKLILPEMQHLAWELVR